jgi:hypothetical protein
MPVGAVHLRSLDLETRQLPTPLINAVQSSVTETGMAQISQRQRAQGGNRDAFDVCMAEIINPMQCELIETLARWQRVEREASGRAFSETQCQRLQRLLRLENETPEREMVHGAVR